MEIFNANNASSQVNNAQRKRQEQRADRTSREDKLRFAGYLDEAELDAEVGQVERTEKIREAAANDQEAAHEDREEHGLYAPDGGELLAKPPKVDLEG